MRINFRAWLKNENKMVDVKSLHLSTRKIMYGYSEGPYIHGNITKPFNEIILMQSTGLKDKNGKDIYEDDIVNAFDGDNYYVNCCIGYSKGVFYLFKPYHPHFYVLFNKLQEIEVIGNVYENKELVENE